MIYLDASALVTLVSGRRYADELRHYLSTTPGVPMATSTIGLVETVRTLDRVGSCCDIDGRAHSLRGDGQSSVSVRGVYIDLVQLVLSNGRELGL